MSLTKYLYSVSIILLVFTNLIAQDNKIKKIDALMNSAHRAGIFNGTVLISESGKTIYQSAFGFSDAKKTARLTKDYRFNIGSARDLFK